MHQSPTTKAVKKCSQKPGTQDTGERLGYKLCSFWQQCSVLLPLCLSRSGMRYGQDWYLWNRMVSDRPRGSGQLGRWMYCNNHCTEHRFLCGCGWEDPVSLWQDWMFPIYLIFSCHCVHLLGYFLFLQKLSCLTDLPSHMSTTIFKLFPSCYSRPSVSPCSLPKHSPLLSSPSSSHGPTDPSHSSREPWSRNLDMSGTMTPHHNIVHLGWTLRHDSKSL